MAGGHANLDQLWPVVLLLALGVVAAVVARGVRLSPIVGYLVLGAILQLGGLDDAHNKPMVALLSELGVAFLLFDIGLHMSFSRIREQAYDIFGFGPVQLLTGTVGLGLLALGFGLPPIASAIVGSTLALSSTAVVGRLVAERLQQNCPVGRTATAILIFQDLAAILLLIVATTIGDDTSLVAALLGATLKALGAFGIALLLARLAVRPLFDLIARTNNEEVFTATALLVVLAAGWGTGSLGLSLTLGAFLGGLVIAETPYRPIVQSEIKPFRSLLLGFFFISVGLSLDLPTLARSWPAALGVMLLLVAAKAGLNIAAALVFRWSVPGSVQLGLLIAQGSEFAFVILSLPALREMLGASVASILIAAVAGSLAITPTMADAGRRFAGHLRARKRTVGDQELQPGDLEAPVIIVGMGEVGRNLADALAEFRVRYTAIERDHGRFMRAHADGYSVIFGDASDPRIWNPMAMQERCLWVVTSPDPEISIALNSVVPQLLPQLQQMVVVADEADRARFAASGAHVVLDKGSPRGLEAAAAVLSEFGHDRDEIEHWQHRQRERAESREYLDLVSFAKPG